MSTDLPYDWDTKPIKEPKPKPIIEKPGTSFTDSKGQRYIKLPNGQIVKADHKFKT